MLYDQSSGDLFRLKLLPQTVDHARSTVPLYRHLYGGITIGEVHSYQELSKLPVVTKRMVAQAGEGALSESCTTAYLQHTSRTTGRALMLHRSHGEAQFIDAFFDKVAREKNEPIKGITLSLDNVVHGTLTHVPKSSFVVRAAVFDESMLRAAKELLLTKYRIPGYTSQITQITGPLQHLMVFTQYLRESGIDTRSLKIQSVVTYGWYLTPFYCRFLMESWNCPVIDRYSMAEVFGGATRVNGGDFVFDPHVIPEVVDYNGKPALPGTEGRLVLTSLFPFVQRQPMIRYESGDIFSYTRDSAGVLRYRYRGRAASSLVDPHHPGSYLIASADLFDAVNDIPWLRKLAASETLLKDNTVFGNPCFVGRVKSNNTNDTRHVQLQFEACTFVTHAQHHANRLGEQIADMLRRASPRLVAAESSGRIHFSVEVIDPGRIERYGPEKELWDFNIWKTYAAS